MILNRFAEMFWKLFQAATYFGHNTILCYGFGLMLYGSGSGRIRIRVLVVEYFMIYKKYNGFPWEWPELVDWCRGKPWTGCTGGTDPARTSCK